MWSNVIIDETDWLTTFSVPLLVPWWFCEVYVLRYFQMSKLLFLAPKSHTESTDCREEDGNTNDTTDTRLMLHWVTVCHSRAVWWLIIGLSRSAQFRVCVGKHMHTHVYTYTWVWSGTKSSDAFTPTYTGLVPATQTLIFPFLTLSIHLSWTQSVTTPEFLTSLPFPFSSISTPRIRQSQILRIFCGGGHKPIQLPRNASVWLQIPGTVHSHSPSHSFGHKVQVVWVIKGWGVRGFSGYGNQVSWVFHTVTCTQTVGVASVYFRAFPGQGGGPVGDH